MDCAWPAAGGVYSCILLPVVDAEGLVEVEGSIKSSRPPALLDSMALELAITVTGAVEVEVEEGFFCGASTGMGLESTEDEDLEAPADRKPF